MGPESAGSIPGPAAYDQGGREPTVTDADLVLGYLSPERFHGGQLALKPRRAERAIRDGVAEPLGIEVEEAALLIKRIIDAKMGAEIYKETVLKGYDPRDFVIFAAGGAGPVHCCGYAEAAAMGKVVDLPVLVGVLRLRLVDDGCPARVRALATADAADAGGGALV